MVKDIAYSVYAMTKVDPDHRFEFYKWIQSKVREDAHLLGVIVWIADMTFMLNGTE